MRWDEATRNCDDVILTWEVVLWERAVTGPNTELRAVARLQRDGDSYRLLLGDRFQARTLAVGPRLDVLLLSLARQTAVTLERAGFSQHGFMDVIERTSAEADADPDGFGRTWERLLSTRLGDTDVHIVRHENTCSLSSSHRLVHGTILEGTDLEGVLRTLNGILNAPSLTSCIDAVARAETTYAALTTRSTKSPSP